MSVFLLSVFLLSYYQSPFVFYTPYKFKTQCLESIFQSSATQIFSYTAALAIWSNDYDYDYDYKYSIAKRVAPAYSRALHEAIQRGMREDWRTNNRLDIAYLIIESRNCSLACRLFTVLSLASEVEDTCISL